MSGNKKKTVSLYRITNLINDKKYIGITRKTVEERWRTHNTNYALTTHKGALQGAILKYGKDNFHIESLCEIFSEEDAKIMERIFIKEEGTMWPVGYNMTSGGERLPGYIRSEETRRRSSASLKGREMTEKMRSALLASHLGKPMSKKTKNKIRKSLKGRPSPLRGKPLSDEHKAKISKLFKGRISPLRGRKASSEARENMRISQTGRKHSEETLKKMRGQKRSQETRDNIKKALAVHFEKRKAYNANTK